MKKMRKIRIYLRQYGQIRTFDADSLPTNLGIFDAPVLERCSTQCLERVGQLVEATRQLEKESPEEQRARTRQGADQARGYGLYRANDNDSLSDSFKAPEGPTSAATDRSVPVVAESAKQLWIDPSTGAYYQPLALKKLFTTNPNLIRTMMRTDLAFTNRLLNAGN